MQAAFWKEDLQTGGFNLMAIEISEVQWDWAGCPAPVALCLPMGSESSLPRGCHDADLVENNKGKHKMSLRK